MKKFILFLTMLSFTMFSQESTPTMSIIGTGTTTYLERYDFYSWNLKKDSSGNIEIKGDSLSAFKTLFKELKNLQAIINKKDSIIDNLKSSACGFLNQLPDAFKTKEGNKKWPTYWYYLHKYGCVTTRIITTTKSLNKTNKK